MTVAQLIEMLKQMPQELEVRYDGDEGVYLLEDARLYDPPNGRHFVLIS